MVLCLKLWKGTCHKEVLRCIKRLFSYSAGKESKAGSTKMGSWGRFQDKTYPLPPSPVSCLTNHITLHLPVLCASSSCRPPVPVGYQSGWFAAECNRKTRNRDFFLTVTLWACSWCLHWGIPGPWNLPTLGLALRRLFLFLKYWWTWGLFSKASCEEVVGRTAGPIVFEIRIRQIMVSEGEWVENSLQNKLQGKQPLLC